MSRFLSDRFAGIEPYTPGEQPQNRTYIKLNTNENPYPPSPRVLEALLGAGASEAAAAGTAAGPGAAGAAGAAMNEGGPGAASGAKQPQKEGGVSGEIDKLRLYSDPEATELCKAIAEFYGLKSSQIIVGNGSDEILAFAFLAFGDQGKPVRFPSVSYGFYPVFAQLFHIPAEPMSLREDFTIDLDDYINCGRNVVIANPNAPTGIALSLDQVEAVARSNSGHLVIIDEAYVDFGADTAVALVDKYDNLMVVQTFSKSRSLAGARLGFAAASEEIIEDMNKMKFSFNPYNVNRLSILAGTAAMRDREYFDACRQEIQRTREGTAERLRAMGFTVLPSRANFLFAGKNSSLGGGEYFQKLRERGILVRHWNKPEIADYVRITVGTPEDMETLCTVTEELLVSG